MAIRVLPNAEKVAADYLRSHADITAGVSTDVPKEPTFPWITVNRVGGVPSIANYLDVARLEVSAWGSTRSEALAQARRAEAVILTLPGLRPDATVTGVVQVGEGFLWNPDQVTNRPRYTFVVEVYLHP